MKTPVVTGLVVATLACSHAAWAEGPWTPYYKNFPGQDMKGHYVHLTGTLDPALEQIERNNLATTYQTCKYWKDEMSARGVPVRPIAPAPEIPLHPWSSDLEVYYGPGRSATLLSTTEHYIDLAGDHAARHEGILQSDCRMKTLTTKTLQVRHGAQICDIDLVKMQLKPSAYCSGSIPIPSGAAGRQLAESIARSRSMLAAGPRPLPPMTGPAQAVGGATGETKTILGMKCQIYGSTSLLRFCIASPASSFPYPPAQPHDLLPGVVLEYALPAMGMTYKAQEAVLEMSVGAALFERPAGITLAKPIPPGGRAGP
jgi:hypothetical protein